MYSPSCKSVCICTEGAVGTSCQYSHVCPCIPPVENQCGYALSTQPEQVASISMFSHVFHQLKTKCGYALSTLGGEGHHKRGMYESLLEMVLCYHNTVSYKTVAMFGKFGFNSL